MTPLPPLKTDLRGAVSRLREKNRAGTSARWTTGGELVRLATVDMASANQ
jgi:hypothetical protein